MSRNLPMLTCLPESEDSASPLKRKDSEQLLIPKTTPTSALSISTTSPACPTLATSKPSLETRLAGLMCLQGACLASLQVLSDKCAVLLTSVGSGPKLSEWSACFDQPSASLRTRQASLFSNPGEPGTELCQDWSRSGMIVGGMYFPLPRLVPDILENESCSSLPTPLGADGKHMGHGNTEHLIKNTMLPTPVGADGARGPDYAKANRPGSGSDDLVTTLARLLPTPTARDFKDTPTARDFKDTPNMATTAKDGRERDDQLPRRIYGDESSKTGGASRGGMRLTPEFLCWLMGFPADWLKPLRAVPVTQLCRKSSNPSPEPSGKCS
jgi:hypothetical protein